MDRTASHVNFVSRAALRGLISAGKKPLGFLNPMIYAYGENIFNDITTGNNPGCGTTGFAACSGWDPITGFGSPDYQKFGDVALELT